MTMNDFLMEFLINLSSKINKQSFLESAESIGNQLCEEAIWYKNCCNWVGKYVPAQEPTSNPEDVLVITHALSPELYEGSSGIAYFLTQLYLVTKNEKYKKTAEGAIIQSLSNYKKIPSFEHYGFYSGKIGIAYAGIKIGIEIQNSSITEKAKTILYDVLQEKPTTYQLDIMSGYAGSIPALIELSDLLNEKKILDFAIALGNELISKKQIEQTGWSWGIGEVGTAAEFTQNLTGHSHGSSGVGYSLLELYKKTKDEKFKHAAENAFVYTNSWYSEKEKNWPDLRGLDETTTQTGDELPYGYSWCHGSPGVCLDLMQANLILKTEKYQKYVNAALNKIQSFITSKDYLTMDDYSLCHGFGGLCDPLILASDIQRDDSLKSLPEQIGMQGIENYLKKNESWPCGYLTDGTPTLMCGLAGIGYFYLRLYDSKKIPSILFLTPLLQTSGSP